jgi:O-antigen ligase
LLGLGGLALVLGFFQMAQGPSGSLRFYEVTNASEAVGFFANRNHFAAGLYVTLVLGGLWHISTARQLLQTSEATSRSVLWLTTAALFLVCVVAGLAMARSRAGMILAMAALIGIVLMVLRERNDGEDSKVRSRITMGRMSIMTVLFAAIFAAQFGLGSIMSRFEGDQLEELRVPLARTTLETALQSLPFGVGLGSFVPVYATVEKDKDILDSYANRAHNDLAEIFLETGVFGLLLLLAFFLWFFPKAWKVWLKPDGGKQSVQVRLQRAATLIIMLLLAHSLVDYPLRTTALASLFAFFCAILATEAPAPQARPIQPDRKRPAPRKPELHGMPGDKWGEDLQWPKSWQRPTE